MIGLSKGRLLAIAFAAFALFTPATSGAQTFNPYTDQLPFFAAALSEFISDSRAFTARAELQLPAAQGEAPMVIPFIVAMRDGKMRWDLHAKRPGQPALPEEIASVMQTLNLDRIVFIKVPETNAVLALPAQKSYAEIPLKRDAELENQAELKMGRMEKKLVGKETLDGHPCEVFKLVLPESKEKQEEAAVWQATDLKDMPIRIRIRIKDSLYALTFRNVNYTAPDVKVFDKPVNFTKFETVDAMLSATALKSLGSNSLSFKSLLGQ